MLRSTMMLGAVRRALSSSVGRIKDKKDMKGVVEVSPEKTAYVRRKLGIPPPRDRPRPSRADDAVSKLHAEITYRRKEAMAARKQQAEAAEEEPATRADELDEEDDINRPIHVDNLRILRAGDHVRIEMDVTGVVQEPETTAVQREMRKHTLVDHGYSPHYIGFTRELENDGFLSLLDKQTSRDVRRFDRSQQQQQQQQQGNRGGQQRGGPRRPNSGTS